MALTYIGETEFVQSGPPQWNRNIWDLDTLIVPYSGAAPGLNDFIDSLPMGAGSDLDGNMFLSDYRVGGSKQYPLVDLIFSGKKDGELPPAKHSSGTTVQSASSSRSSTGIIATSPATIQFYAPTSTLEYISTSPGTTAAPSPSGSPTLITWTVGDTSLAITDVIADLLNIFFTVLPVSTIESTEIVADQYWRNTARTTVGYVPYIFDVGSGAFVTLASPGNGYTASDTLTVSAGDGSATIVVDSVGSAWGGGTGILSYHVTSATFTLPHALLVASGGTGSGAMFNVMIIP